MKVWIAFWNILAKDMRTYYLKPPNISWGIIFPLAWAGMFFLRSGAHPNELRALIPGVMTLSIIFGTTSLLAVAIAFEKMNRSFERLLLAPISLPLLMLAKTSGAIVFGVLNAFIPLLLGMLIINLSGINWLILLLGVFLTSVSSAFLGLLIAVSVTAVFDAQTVSNFFRFPMIFLCGLFFPVQRLPLWLRFLSFALPPTYGADMLHQATGQTRLLPLSFDLIILILFGLGLFLLSLHTINRRWII
jgi:ABC-2 type transport system permease protein